MRISDWSSDVCSSDLLGGLTRHAAQMQTIEQHFRDADFVVRDLAVCLADGAHHRKGRIEKLRLDLGRGADDRNLEYARDQPADQRADHHAGKAAGDEPDQAADENKRIDRKSTRLNSS